MEYRNIRQWPNRIHPYKRSAIRAAHQKDADCQKEPDQEASEDGIRSSRPHTQIGIDPTGNRLIEISREDVIHRSTVLNSIDNRPVIKIILKKNDIDLVVEQAPAADQQTGNDDETTKSSRHELRLSNLVHNIYLP